MYVPTEKDARDNKIKWIADTCLRSQRDRMAMYDRRRRYFLFGTYSADRALYNRLFAHTDLVTSFLYAADKVRFSIAAPRNADDVQIAMYAGVQDLWNDEFRDAGLAYDFGDALLWATALDSMFMKIGYNEGRDELYSRLVLPHQFGVFDESETDLDGQEAFVHEYALPWENACMRLMRAGRREDIPRLRADYTTQAPTYPAVLQNMIIGSTGGANLGGPMIGALNPSYEPQALYEPKSETPKVLFKEVWVWDDSNDDYMWFVMADPDIVLEDSRDTCAALKVAGKLPLAQKGKRKAKSKKGDDTEAKYASTSNYFLAGEHPFVHIAPYRLLDYFWGEAHIERLIKLQVWTSERLDQIHEILAQQADPAKVFSGFTGLLDEKANALGGPGTWVSDMLPGAKVERLSPELPPDLFQDLVSINGLFLEASGLTETVMGRGEQGVRGRGHAKQLATTGSGRIRKVAVGLEPSLVRCGDLGLKLKRMKDPIPLKLESGQEFVLSQMEPSWRMRVAGHSHSPLFSDEERDIAALLFKAQAIDREMLIRMMHPPDEANMIHKLRKRIPEEKKAAALKMLAGAGKKGNGMGLPTGG